MELEHHPSEEISKEKISKEFDSIPYAAGWVDILIQWIKRLPIPSWLFYILLLGVIEIIVNASRWIDGSATIGSFGSFFPYQVTGLYCVLSLASIHYIDEVADRSFNDFLPALGLSRLESNRLRYQLLTMPPRESLLFALIGFILGLPIIFLSNFTKTVSLNTLSFIVVAIVSCLGFIMTAELLYHTVHQLRLVSHIHSVATKIDLLNQVPLYSFSRLSSLTGLIFLLVLWFDLAVNPETLRNLGLITLNFAGLGLLALASFLLPLAGMHRKLDREKKHLQWEVNKRLKNSMQQLFQQIDREAYADVEQINKTISGLLSTQDFVVKIPTWPWSTQTFTFFIGALVLPLVLIIIQAIVNNILGIN